MCVLIRHWVVVSGTRGGRCLTGPVTPPGPVQGGALSPHLGNLHNRPVLATLPPHLVCEEVWGKEGGVCLLLQWVGVAPGFIVDLGGVQPQGHVTRNDFTDFRVFTKLVKNMYVWAIFYFFSSFKNK